ncbi:hypothetical protein [Streptosporangium sp. NPDC002607]
MSSNSRTSSAGVLFLLGVLAIAVALVGAAGHYVFLNQPVVLTGVAALLIAGAGWLRFGKGYLVPAVVLAMVWVVVSARFALPSRGTDEVIPGPAGTGLTMRVEYGKWDWFSEWILVVRKDAGLLTRQWDVGCSGRRWADIPEVTWTDPARPRLNDRVLVLNPETGRPHKSASSFDFC